MPALKDVPGTLPIEIRIELTRDYAALASHLDAIQKQIQLHDQKCTPVPAGSATATACEQEQRVLDALIQPYATNVKQFNHLLDEAATLQDQTWSEFSVGLQKIRTSTDATLNALVKQMQEARIDAGAAAAHARIVHEGVFLGLLTNQQDADDLLAHDTSPFAARSYREMQRKGEVMALSFGTGADFSKEIERGIADHLSLGRYTLSQDRVAAVVHALNGTRFDRLIAHSNGATIAEALLRADIIRAGELDIAGGDRSLVNYDSLKELIESGRVERVVVWLNPGDPIPIATGSETSRELEVLRAAEHYMVDKYNNRPDAKVQYRYMLGRQYKGQEIAFTSHYLREAYFPNMRVIISQRER
jgi:hypothetical protein